MDNAMGKCLFAVGGVLISLGLSAAALTGELYGGYRDDAIECSLWRVTPADAASSAWRDCFVEVDGAREPAQFGWDWFAWPVQIAPGETFTPEIVWGTATAAHVKSCRMLSDQEMLNLFSGSGEWRDDSGYHMRQLWMGGALATRAWILVEHANVVKGPAYSLDLNQAPVLNGGGQLTSTSVAAYASSLGVKLSGTRSLTQSVWYSVRIRETGEQYTGFNGRVWNVCDPFFSTADGTALDAIDERGGDSELFDAVGLYYVAPEMVSGGGASAPVLSEVWKKARTRSAVVLKERTPSGLVLVKIGKANPKTGAVKISATYTALNGKKTALKQVERDVRVSNDGVACTLAGKGMESLSLSIVGENISGSLGGSNVTGDCVVGGPLVNPQPAFTVEAAPLAGAIGGVLGDLLPKAETFTSSGAKWTFAKAASVKWAKDRQTQVYGLVVDTSNGKTNLSGLKLSYAVKTGLFKGTFKTYALNEKNGRMVLSKYPIAVSGVVVDGCGYGIAVGKQKKTTVTAAVYIQ